MRIIRFVDATGKTRYGIPELNRSPGENWQAYPLPVHSQNELFELDASERAKMADLAVQNQPESVGEVLLPVPPVNIFCIGINYREHAAEMGRELPPYPVVFMKPTTCAISAGTPILIPACATRGPETDYEVELALVIGRNCRNVTAKNALDYVFGYQVGNDISARRWQKHAGGGQWIRGKSFDSFLPLGTAIVTQEPDQSLDNSPNAIHDPQKIDLRTVLKGNGQDGPGEVMQNSSTSDMIFTVAEIISYLSQDTTLLPGTLIMTGTPPGVGMAKNSPRWLMPGDEVTVSSNLLGELTNPVIAAEKSE